MEARPVPAPGSARRRSSASTRPAPRRPGPLGSTAIPSPPASAAGPTAIRPTRCASSPGTRRRPLRGAVDARGVGGRRRRRRARVRLGGDGLPELRPRVQGARPGRPRPVRRSRSPGRRSDRRASGRRVVARGGRRPQAPHRGGADDGAGTVFAAAGRPGSRCGDERGRRAPHDRGTTRTREAARRGDDGGGAPTAARRRPAARARSGSTSARATAVPDFNGDALRRLVGREAAQPAVSAASSGARRGTVAEPPEPSGIGDAPDAAVAVRARR